MPVNDVTFEIVSHKVLLMILIDIVSERTAEIKIGPCIEKKTITFIQASVYQQNALNKF